ncbi:MAG TPA: alpha/beta hydrolase [Dongiaceae bacterium]
MRRIVGLAAFVMLAGIFAGSLGGFTRMARADDPWMVLPPTPALPKAAKSGLAPVDGIKIWYAEFGPSGAPIVIMLHGGLGNSNYFGNQVPVLARKYRVIVMDSRGHGRSSRDAQPYGYDLMSNDVLALMDYLHVKKAAIVGWSDGAIIGLDIAIHHPERIAKLFAFAANSDPSGVADISKSKVFNDYINGTEKEYAALSPTPKDHKAFLDEIGKMWASQPNFTKQQLAGITTPTLIVDGDHDEAIKRENTEYMATTIPHAGLLILPRVGHFAFLQDPAQFNDALKHFLTHLPDAK